MASARPKVTSKIRPIRRQDNRLMWSQFPEAQHRRWTLVGPDKVRSIVEISDDTTVGDCRYFQIPRLVRPFVEDRVS
jgi:hypothetical protein